MKNFLVKLSHYMMCTKDNPEGKKISHAANDRGDVCTGNCSSLTKSMLANVRPTQTDL